MMKPIRRHGLFVILIAFLGFAWQQSSTTFAEIKRSDRSHSAFALNSLNVDYIHQEKLLCVPTSASMIMAFYGDRQSPRKLKTMSRGRNYVASDPFNDFSITFYRDILKAAAALGYDWSERALDDNEFGFQGLLSSKVKLIIDDLL